jgi:hypothetical protein
VPRAVETGCRGGHGSPRAVVRTGCRDGQGPPRAVVPRAVRTGYSGGPGLLQG